MADQLYCLSDPAEPGLVRIASQCGSSGLRGGDIRNPGEKIDWVLEVRNARTVIKVLHRTMCRYRKNRGGGVYRCSSLDAHNIAVRYAARSQKNWSNWFLQQIGGKIPPSPHHRAGPVSAN